MKNHDTQTALSQDQARLNISVLGKSTKGKRKRGTKVPTNLASMDQTKIIFVLDCRKTYKKKNQKRRKEGVGNHAQKNFNAMCRRQSLLLDRHHRTWQDLQNK